MIALLFAGGLITATTLAVKKSIDKKRSEHTPFTTPTPTTSLEQQEKIREFWKQFNIGFKPTPTTAETANWEQKYKTDYKEMTEKVDGLMRMVKNIRKSLFDLNKCFRKNNLFESCRQTK